VENFRRYSPFVISLKENTGGLCRGRFEQELQAQALETSSEKEHLAILKKSSRRRNRWSGFTEENCEILSAVRSRGVAPGLRPKEQRKNPEDTSRYWHHRVFIG
jgi:hypothetical protein